MPRTHKQKFILVGLSLFFALMGCGRTAGAELEPTDLPVPTFLPTPTISADRVVLVRSANADPSTVANAETLLRELSGGSGLEFEIRDDLANNEVTTDIKVVVFLEKPDNLGSLAADAPATQFVAITSEDWNPAENVSIIRLREENTAFLAGYLAAMLAPNYRVGALLASESTTFNQAFVNGVFYYCGNCASQIYPLNTYPSIATQPAGSPASAWQAGFNELNAKKVNVLYVANEAVSPELFAFFATQDVALIGSQSPFEEGRSKWVATIIADGLSPIRDIWADLLAGNGGKVLNASLSITDNMFINVQDGLVWLSEGKLNYARETINLIRDNRINPLPVN